MCIVGDVCVRGGCGRGLDDGLLGVFGEDGLRFYEGRVDGAVEGTGWRYCTVVIITPEFWAR